MLLQPTSTYLVPCSEGQFSITDPGRPQSTLLTPLILTTINYFEVLIIRLIMLPMLKILSSVIAVLCQARLSSMTREHLLNTTTPAN